jgi:hypothetical protein
LRLAASGRFWDRVYDARRGPLDVRAVCGGQHAHDWVYEGRGRSYRILWALCEERFRTMPRVKPRRVERSRAIASQCPRCGGTGVVEEVDRHGPSRYHIICGYRWEA